MSNHVYLHTGTYEETTDANVAADWLEDGAEVLYRDGGPFDIEPGPWRVYETGEAVDRVKEDGSPIVPM